MEIVVPIPNSAAPPAAMLVTMASVPLKRRRGTTGITAPIAKSSIEEPAAAHGEPPRSEGSMPSSSRASTSESVLGSARSLVDRSLASSEVRPLAS